MYKFCKNNLLLIIIYCLLSVSVANALSSNTNNQDDNTKQENIKHNPPKFVDPSDDMFDIDLNTAIEMGIKNNLSLQNKKISVDSNTLDMATSWNNIISSNLSVKYDNSIVEKNVPTGNAGNISVTMNNGININANNIYNIINSVSNYQKGKLSYEEAKSSLKKDIKQSYFNLALQKQKIWLKQIERDNAQISYDKAQLKYKDGMISEVDLLKTQYTFIKILPELDSLYNNYINSEESFKQIIGLVCDKKLHYTTHIPESIEHLKIDKNLAKNLDKNFTVANYILALKSAINSRNQSIISTTTPTFSLTHSLSLLDNNQLDLNNKVGLSLSFSLNTPFPFSSEQVKIAKNVYSVKQATNELQNIKEKQIIEINKLINEIELQEKNIRSYNINITVAEKTFDMTERLYNAGSSSYLEYQDAKKNLYDAKMQIIEAKNSYLSKIFELEHLIQTQLLDLQ